MAGPLPRAAGRVTHTLPAAVETGSYHDCTVTCTAGYFGVDDTGGVRLCLRLIGNTVLGGDRNVLFLTEPHRPPATLR